MPRLVALLLAAAATAASAESDENNFTAASADEGRVKKFAAESYDWLADRAPAAKAFAAQAAAQHGPGRRRAEAEAQVRADESQALEGQDGPEEAGVAREVSPKGEGRARAEAGHQAAAAVGDGAPGHQEDGVGPVRGVRGPVNSEHGATRERLGTRRLG